VNEFGILEHLNHNSSSSANGQQSKEIENVFDSPLQSIMDVFVMSLGDVQVIYNQLLMAPYPITAKVVRVYFIDF
jgi:ABC-type bacteriocin/lantibiotic exporter with double-glycine peptidase domain